MIKSKIKLSGLQNGNKNSQNITNSVISRLYYMDAVRRMGKNNRVSREVTRIEKRENSINMSPHNRSNSKISSPIKKMAGKSFIIQANPLRNRPNLQRKSENSIIKMNKIGSFNDTCPSNDNLHNYSRDALVTIFSRALMLVSDPPKILPQSTKSVLNQSKCKISNELNKTSINPNDIDISIKKVKRIQKSNMSEILTELDGKTIEQKPVQKFATLLENIKRQIYCKSKHRRVSSKKSSHKKPVCTITLENNNQQAATSVEVNKLNKLQGDNEY